MNIGNEDAAPKKKSKTSAKASAMFAKIKSTGSKRKDHLSLDSTTTASVLSAPLVISLDEGISVSVVRCPWSRITLIENVVLYSDPHWTDDKTNQFLIRLHRDKQLKTP